MKKSIIALSAALICTIAGAQAIKITTGGSTGTYSRLAKEMSTACMSAVPIAETNSTGSMQNVLY